MFLLQIFDGRQKSTHTSICCVIGGTCLPHVTVIPLIEISPFTMEFWLISLPAAILGHLIAAMLTHYTQPGRVFCEECDSITVSLNPSITVWPLHSTSNQRHPYCQVPWKNGRFCLFFFLLQFVQASPDISQHNWFSIEGVYWYVHAMSKIPPLIFYLTLHNRRVLACAYRIESGSAPPVAGSVLWCVP